MTFTAIKLMIALGCTCALIAALARPDTSAIRVDGGAMAAAEGNVIGDPPWPQSDVVLRSHLDGPLNADPPLVAGRMVRVIPAENEPFRRFEPVIVRLPSHPPFAGIDRQLFLRGFAISALSDHNGHFR